jgi:7,8-dihydropterin-6-yl-methyl-4-(beta-D-ribofuranosyl)aminobenzene 5'-phosphate synthase
MKKILRWIILIPVAGLALCLGVVLARPAIARIQGLHDPKSLEQFTPFSIGETKTLDILPLYENAAQGDLAGGHGVSYLIRTDGATILFDLGNNMTAASPSPLEQNMTSLGISLDQVDVIVISHRHPDHVGGQNWWMAGTFSLDGKTQAPLGNIPVYVPEEMSYPGVKPVLAVTPTLLAEGVATTGLMPYYQLFPVWLQTPIGYEESLAVDVSGEGIVLITGCGHMGLKALLERAQKVFDAPIVGVVGGLHYGDASAADLQDEIGLLQAIQPHVIALSPHDSGEAALQAFAQAFPGAYTSIVVGQPIRLPAAVAAP